LILKHKTPPAAADCTAGCAVASETADRPWGGDQIELLLINSASLSLCMQWIFAVWAGQRFRLICDLQAKSGI
jgi:hypothetical protein